MDLTLYNVQSSSLLKLYITCHARQSQPTTCLPPFMLNKDSTQVLHHLVRCIDNIGVAVLGQLLQL
jgi:hypothetical protein